MEAAHLIGKSDGSVSCYQVVETFVLRIVDRTGAALNCGFVDQLSLRGRENGVALCPLCHGNFDNSNPKRIMEDTSHIRN